MTISLVNRTNKSIVFGSMIFHFLDTGDCKSLPCAQATPEFGRRSPIDAYDGTTGRPLRPEKIERQPLDWKPEQTIVIHISDYMGEIEQSLANFMSVTDLSKVNIYRWSFTSPTV